MSSLSQLYGVTLEDALAANPQVDLSSLQVG